MKKTPRFPISVEGIACSATQTRVTARTHEGVIDEPTERAGTDLGMTPLETLMAAFAGCTTVILNVIAKERGWTIADLKINVTGHLDPRGVRQGIAVERVFPEVDLAVTGRVEGANVDLAALRTELAVRCPVSALLRAAGSDVRECWRLDARPGAHSSLGSPAGRSAGS